MKHNAKLHTIFLKFLIIEIDKKKNCASKSLKDTGIAIINNQSMICLNLIQAAKN